MKCKFLFWPHWYFYLTLSSICTFSWLKRRLNALLWPCCQDCMEGVSDQSRGCACIAINPMNHRSMLGISVLRNLSEMLCFLLTSILYILWYAPWINGWVNNREAGDLRKHRAHYDVIVGKWGTWQLIIISQNILWPPPLISDENTLLWKMCDNYLATKN